MRRRWLLGPWLAAGLLAAAGAQDVPAASAAPAAVAAPDVSVSVERLAWLGGCWARDRAEPGSGEHWMPLAGGTLLGVSRRVHQGRTAGVEFMQIRRLPDGAVAFIAHLPGQPDTTFLLRPGPPAVAVFENPQHDFPQRVIYRQVDGVRMQARIEGERQGHPAAVDFAFTRTACAAAPARPAPTNPPAAADAAGKPRGSVP